MLRNINKFQWKKSLKKFLQNKGDEDDYEEENKKIKMKGKMKKKSLILGDTPM